MTAGAALLAGAVVALFGSAPGMWVVAALSAAFVDRVQRALSRAGIAAFFSQAVSAAIPTSVAAGLYWLESQGSDMRCTVAYGCPSWPSPPPARQPCCRGWRPTGRCT